MAQAPPATAATRDNALSLLRDLTVTVAIAATALLGMLTLIAAVTIPGQNSSSQGTAGTVETAVNALWDAGPLLGDRVTVVGAGMVVCCVARLLARFPGADVELVDVDGARAGVAARLGARFAAPGEATGERDLVVHAS